MKQKSDRKHLVYYVSILFSFTEDFHVLKERVVIENPQGRDNFVLCFDWAEIFIDLDFKLKSSSSDQQPSLIFCGKSCGLTEGWVLVLILGSSYYSNDQLCVWNEAKNYSRKLEAGWRHIDFMCSNDHSFTWNQRNINVGQWISNDPWK